MLTCKWYNMVCLYESLVSNLFFYPMVRTLGVIFIGISKEFILGFRFSFWVLLVTLCVMHHFCNADHMVKDDLFLS